MAPTQPSEALFKIPTNSLLNADTIHIWSTKYAATDLTAIQLLTSYLALYRSNSLQDEWFGPYLQSLPENFDFHPLTWTLSSSPTKRRLVANLPPSVQEKVLKVKKRFLADKAAIRRKFVRRHSVVSSSLTSLLSPSFQKATVYGDG